MKRWNILLMVVVLALLTVLSGSNAQQAGTGGSGMGVVTDEETVTGVPAQEEGREGAPPQKEGMTLFQLILKGGVVGHLIILLSFVALGLVIDYAITIRRARLSPAGDIATFKDLAVKEDFSELRQVARKKPTFMSSILAAGLDEINLGYPAMIKAMEDTAEFHTARIARRIEHLNVIANIAPMMGLLGTVTGMIRCFIEISQVSASVDPKQLAAGIFEALVTTVEGLIVAIPTLYFYAIFRNRLDELAGEASVAAEQIIASFKPRASQRGD